MKQKKAVVIVLMVLLALPVFAERTAMPPLDMPTTASDGYGGHHLAYTDNVFSLFVNPAAMIQVQQRSFFTLSSTFFSPETLANSYNPIVSMIGGDLDALGELADTLSGQNKQVALGVDIRELPFSFAWVANGFGFGLWNRTFLDANIKREFLEVDIFADVMLPIGFAFKIVDLNGHSLDAGVTLKPFARVKAYGKEKIITLVGDTSDLVDKLNVPLIMGLTFDLGFMYRWDIGLRAGLTFDDVFSFGKVVRDFVGSDDNSYYIPFTMNLGLAYELKISKFGFTLMLDWHDIANAFMQDNYLNRNSSLDLSLGFQFSMFDMLKLRIGLNEMLPSFGFGVNLGPVEIDFAYYGKEFGSEPGQFSNAMIGFSVSVRPGAKKRNWPWARRAIFGGRNDDYDYDATPNPPVPPTPPKFEEGSMQDEIWNAN